MEKDALIQTIRQNATEDASNKNELEHVLNQAVKLSVSDSQFREELGTSFDFWNASLPIFNAGLEDESKKDACLIAILKLTRNIVANHLASQQIAIQCGALEKVETLVQDSVQHAFDQHLIIVQVGTQAICNMITNYPVALNDTWKKWMSSSASLSRGMLWSKVLSLSDSVAIMSTQVLILNSIRDSPNRCELLVSTENGLSILRTMLDDMDRLHKDEESKNFELGYAIVGEIIIHGHFVRVFDNMQGPGTASVASSRQTTLLKLLDSKVDAHDGEFPTFMRSQEFQFIAQHVPALSLRASQAIKSALESGKGSSDLDVEDVSNVYTRLVLLFQIASTLLAAEDNQRLDLQKLLAGEGAMGKAVELLRLLEELDPASKKPSGHANKLGFDYLKRDVVKFIGMMCFKDKKMQDEVRESQAIPLILGQCRIDDNNPYIREYAVLALRNILDNNPKNQALIEGLEPREIEEGAELEQLGYKAKLVNGKVQLEKSG